MAKNGYKLGMVASLFSTNFVVKIQPGMSTEAAGGWGSWTRTNGRQGLARVKVWCLTILAIPQYITKEPYESICKNQKTEGKSSEEELDIEL